MSRLKPCPFCGVDPDESKLTTSLVGFVDHRSTCYLYDSAMPRQMIMRTDEWNERYEEAKSSTLQTQ